MLVISLLTGNLFKRYDEFMIKILLLVFAVSIDGFAAALGMGSAGIKIPFRSAVIISFTGTFFLVFSAALAGAARFAASETFCSILSFVLLTALGIFNLLKNFLSELAKKNKIREKNPALLLLDGTAADKDHSKSISVREAAALSIALSADSAVTGVSAGFGSRGVLLLALLSFAVGLASVMIGQKLGKIAFSLINKDLGWICGAMLIVLAFLNLCDVK